MLTQRLCGLRTAYGIYISAPFSGGQYTCPILPAKIPSIGQLVQGNVVLDHIGKPYTPAKIIVEARNFATFSRKTSLSVAMQLRPGFYLGLCATNMPYFEWTEGYCTKTGEGVIGEYCCWHTLYTVDGERNPAACPVYPELGTHPDDHLFWVSPITGIDIIGNSSDPKVQAIYAKLKGKVKLPITILPF